MTPSEVLKKYWGYDGFRPLQREIVDAVLAGRDTLGLMPTGGGKSITFQVPGMMLPGLTVVVTPLISLMKDQVDNLKRRHIRAVFLHSGMTMRERDIAMENLRNGHAKFLYIAPERLKSEVFLAELRRLSVSLIVVDEAHCISQWGYDFRPSYLHIKSLRKVAPEAPVLALTATATIEVAADICRNLEMHDPALLRMSFARRNLSYIVRPSETKIGEVMHILSRTQGTSIVYVRSRKRTREIAEYLNAAGISAAAYHAGLEYSVKEERQNDWKADKIRVMVATNAFGMGIDKPDVRVVIHFDLPPSLEEYYQEAGRAGRDGLPSYAVLLTGSKDTALLRRRVTETFPPRDHVKMVYERVCNFLGVALGEGYDTLKAFDFDAFCQTFHYEPRQTLASLHLLAQAGYVEYLEETDRRARAIILVSREELYQPQGVGHTAENVLGRMLRLYTGLFMEYQAINELQIAKDLDISPDSVYEALLELGRAKIIHYIPRSSDPMIYFPTSREERRYLQIGKDIYEERRDRMKRRTEAMIDYAFGYGRCREARMLEYFGEAGAADCGRCDVCRTKKHEADDPEADLEKVLQFIKTNPGRADFNILSYRLRIPEDNLRQIIGFLLGEGYISDNGGVYVVL